MLEIPYARHEPSFPPRSAERSRHVGLFRGGGIVLRMENDEFKFFLGLSFEGRERKKRVG